MNNLQTVNQIIVVKANQNDCRFDKWLENLTLNIPSEIAHYSPSELIQWADRKINVIRNDYALYHYTGDAYRSENGELQFHPMDNLLRAPSWACTDDSDDVETMIHVEGYGEWHC